MFCAFAGMMAGHKSDMETAKVYKRCRMLFITVFLSIRLLNDCRYVAFVLYYANDVGDIGDFTGIVHEERIGQMPAAASVDVAGENLRLDFAVVEKCSRLGEYLS